MTSVLGMALLGAVGPAGLAVAAVDPVHHTVEVADEGPGSWEVPGLATQVTVTLRGAAGGECFFGSEESRHGGAGGAVTLRLDDDLAGSTVGYTIGGVGAGSPGDGVDERGGGGTALSYGGDLLAVVGGGGGAGREHVHVDVDPDHGCVAGGDGGVATTPGVGPGDPGTPSALFDSHAPGGGATEAGGQPDPEAEGYGDVRDGGHPGQDGPPRSTGETITLSAGGAGGWAGGGGGSGYAGGAGGTTDYGLNSGLGSIDDRGAGGGGSGFLADDERVSVVPGSAGTNAGEGSITIAYLMPGPAIADDAGVETEYGSPVRVTPEVDGATGLSVETPPSFGQATADGMDLVYTPDADVVGTDSFTYTATGPGGASEPATVTITVLAPELAIGSLPEAIQGHPYEHTLTVTGGSEPHEFTAGGLPEGLQLEGGVLSGTPTAAGEHRVSITVADASRPDPATATVELVVHVHSSEFAAPASAEAGTEIALTGTDLPDGDYEIVLNSTPATLGQATIVNGVLEVQVTIPAGTSAGEHTLELVREGVVIGSQPIEITAVAAEPEPTQPAPAPEPTPAADPPAELPETGAAWVAPSALALLLVAAGLLTLAVRSRRALRS
ncbi:Ig-like domain-containing protein [Ruania suaedae]|uniref:Ig-like domain-containing protein n=1 Tax=Ruania suaedae TaxID=2897774 RepID=UPI001E2B8E80|nr:Ig-like domain-containing protein [Ruania suaedae]UFU02918.1 Ig-like domain-containing protein [Ruania suaedae]